MTTSPAADPHPAPSATSSHPRRAGRWVAALVAVVLGILVSGGWSIVAWTAITDRPETFHRENLPGSVVVDLRAGETAVAYVEADAGAAPAEVSVSVTGPDGGQGVARPYRGDLTYDVPGESDRLGRAVALVTATADGPHLVAADGPTGGRTLAVGPDLAHGAVLALVGPGLAFVGFVILALVFLLATGRRRPQEPRAAITRASR